MHIHISIAAQTLTVFEEQQLSAQYAISSAKNGTGELMGSECTPLGQHIIAAKIGDACAENTVFVGRQATGETYNPKLRERYPNRDWILTRILWLAGTEPSKNKGQRDNQLVDSYQRYIYIHGTPDDVVMGVPGSRGCIRMRNQDIIVLFNRVSIGTPVNIIAD